MPEPTPPPLELFFSYSHEDQQLRKKLESHLASLKAKRAISVWHDRQIVAGTDWQRLIDESLNRAAIVLLLVSSDFLSSDYCTGIEMTRALERHKMGEARVIPVILRPCDWTDTPFHDLQVLPSDGRPVTRWPDLDEAFLNVVTEIGRAIKELNQVSLEHYPSFVKRFGVFEGVGPSLKPEQIAQRQNSVRIFRRAGRVEKVHIVNAQGKLTGSYDLPSPTELPKGDTSIAATAECQWEYVRAADGTLLEERAKDQAGRFVSTLRYNPGPDPTVVVAHYLNEAGFPTPRSRSGAASIKTVRSPEGFDREVRFYDKDYNPQPDDNGGYGEVRQLTARGQPGFVTNLGVDGKPGWRKEGFPQFSFAYDWFGNQTSCQLLDLNGQPAFHKDRYAILESSFDEWGNRIESRYLDENRKPVRNRFGFSVWKAKIDAGRQTDFAFFDENGDPVMHVDGYARWTAHYDELGRPDEIRLLDTAGRLASGPDGSARWTYEYDAEGNIHKQSYLDEAGQPAKNKSGYASFEQDFDPQGRPAKTRYYDEAGKLTLNSDGYAQETSTYNSRGYEIQHRFLDGEGRPVMYKDGYAIWRALYDDRGKIEIWACFDRDDHPVRNSDGFSRRENTYNRQGNVTSEFYFDESPEPAAPPAPDAVGARRPYASKSFGVVSRRPAQHRLGYAGWRAQYDDRGFMYFQEFFGRESTRLLLPEGYAAWTSENDERGHALRYTYLGRNLDPVRIKAGYTAWTAKYDKLGNRIEKTYLNEDNQVVRSNEGVATIISAYDWRGNEIELTYRDEEGQPVRHRDGFLKCQRSYNAAGVVVARSFSGFDKSAGPFECRSQYDSHGREVEQRYFDETGRPIHHAEGYEYVTMSYDDQGNQIETSYEGYVGRGPVARRRIRLNPGERLTEDVYLNAANEPVMGPKGYARRTAKRDDRENGISSLQDEHGQVLEVVCFDSANKPAAHAEGWALWSATYDAFGRSGESYFGPDGQPVSLPAGYAAWKVERDAQGHEKELVFLDVGGRPVTGPVRVRQGTANA